MPKVLLSILFICIVWLLPAWAQPYPDSLIHKSYAARAPQLFQFYVTELRDHKNDPGWALQKIEPIEKLARARGDDDLLAETAFMKLHALRYKPGFPKQQLLSKLDSLLTEARRQKQTWLMARIESLAAITCFDEAYNYELGFIHFKKMDEILRGISIADFPDKQICYYQMGYAYYEFAEWENAIRYFQEGLREKPGAKPYKFFIQIHNTLGICYQKLGKFDSSDYHYDQVMAWAREEPPGYEIWDGITSGNKGYNLFLQKRYAEAKPLLEKDVSIAEKYADWRLAVGSLVPLAYIALHSNQLAVASALGAKARQYTIQSGQFTRWEKVYPLLSKLATLQGNRALATRMLDSAMWVKDSVNRQFNAMQMARAEQKIALEKQEATLRLLASEKKLKLWERNMLLLSLGVLLAISAWVFVKLARRARQKQKALALAQQELEEAGKQLEQFTRSILEKNRLIETLLQKSDGEHSQQVEQLRSSTILTEEDWKKFRELFDKAHFGFLDRLGQSAPQLTPSEVRFVTLSKLGMEPKEMAAMLGVGAEAIRQYRSRLRKKLQLTDDKSIEDWILEV